MAHNPNEDLELRIDKFTFRFPTGLRFSEAGLWIRREGGLVRVGLSDFAQRRAGDIAFANLTPAGTVLGIGDEVASIETVKVNISLPSPVNGIVREVNSALQDTPELINQDPYGNGWIALVGSEDLEAPLNGLLDAEMCVALARRQAEAELNPS
ncbi:MAG TPA: glycine cleavage system protein H [Acidobacteriota bacterium]|nr:glycine cleavage system protein H [Acidobacteriota bacterium]